MHLSKLHKKSLGVWETNHHSFNRKGQPALLRKSAAGWPFFIVSTFIIGCQLNLLEERL